MPPDATPVLETARLALYVQTDSDEDAALALALENDADFLRHIGDRGIRTLEQARERLRMAPMACQRDHGFSMYRVQVKATGENAGVCGLVVREGLSHPDLGYAFMPAFRGRGFAAEAAAGVLDHARALGLPALAAVVSPDNGASVVLLERLGFAFQGHIHLPGREDAPVNLYHRSL